MISEAYRKMLHKGNAYAFQVLSERAFGKLKEPIQHEVRPYSEKTDEERIGTSDLNCLPAEISPSHHRRGNTCFQAGLTCFRRGKGSPVTYGS